MPSTGTKSANQYVQCSPPTRRPLAPLISCLLLAMLLTGCRAQTKVLKPPVEISETESPKKVAIFPLADYSQRKPFVESYCAPNLLIVEEITQNLVGYGFKVAIQEDINKVLISEKILIPVNGHVSKKAASLKQNASTPGTMEWDYFNTTHLKEMEEIYRREILDKYKDTNLDNLSSKPLGASKGLNQKTVTELAKRLDVDIILRGRILDYGFKNRDTLSPLHGAGLLTFLVDEPKRFLFGVADQNKYDFIESALVAGALGAGIGGALGNLKIDSTKKIIEQRRGFLVPVRVVKKDSDYISGAALGGAAGGTIGLLRANKGMPQVGTSVMHIRLYAQDGKTGKVIWTNAVEVERAPSSRFAFDDKHPKVLLDKMTREGISLLMSDFHKATNLN